jgi:hypothetical protein
MPYLETMANSAYLGKRVETRSWTKAATLCRLGAFHFREIGESLPDALAEPYKC